MSKLSDPFASIFLAIVAMLLGVLFGDYSAGKRHEIEKIRINNAATEKYNKLVADTERVHRDSRARIAELLIHAERVESNAKITIDKLRSDIRTRVVRVSLPVASCTANTDTGSGTVSLDDGQARAELLPKTVLDLIDIAADANSEVRRTNLCIDQYNEVKAMLDKLRKNKVD